MTAHKIEAVVPADGTLKISDLPFMPGARVQIIVQERADEPVAVTFPLRGLPGEMREPFEPATDADAWDALR